MKIYQYQNYKNFVIESVRSRPRNGRGEYQKIANELRVHPTLISQIFRGPRELTLEQASDLATYLGMDEYETEYFVSLVELTRAGNQRLKEIVQRRLDILRVSQLDNQLKVMA